MSTRVAMTSIISIGASRQNGLKTWVVSLLSQAPTQRRRRSAGRAVNEWLRYCPIGTPYTRLLNVTRNEFKNDGTKRQRLMDDPISDLRMATPASPLLRSLWIRQPQEPGTTMMAVETLRGVTKTKNQRELIWILSMLWDKRSPMLHAGDKTLLDELERLVESDPKNKELVSFRMASLISDLAVLSECLHQVELYHPWASTFQSSWARRDEEVEENYFSLTRGWKVFLKNFEGTSIGALGAIEDGRFHYPVDKRRNQENVRQMRVAEENLDKFWRAVDAFIPISSGATRENAVYDMLSKISGRLQRTPKWVEPEKQAPKPKSPEKSPAEIQFELAYRTQKTTEPAAQVQPKTKVKSRGEPAKPVNVMEPELHPQLNDVQPVFKVDKRSYKVFSILFFQLSQSSQPGEIP